MMPGEFTSRFDKEILKSHLAEENKKKLEAAKEQAEQDRIDADVKKIGEISDRRVPWIRERFPNAEQEKVDHAGFRFRFNQTPERKAASFLLRVRTNESRMAIMVESQYEVPASKVKEYDYISLPTQKVDFDKAKRFIEAKIFDFAKIYVG
jgi:hypothetical protein